MMRTPATWNRAHVGTERTVSASPPRRPLQRGAFWGNALGIHPSGAAIVFVLFFLLGTMTWLIRSGALDSIPGEQAGKVVR